MDGISTDALVDTIPSQRTAGAVELDVAPPLSGCQCRECQGARFL